MGNIRTEYKYITLCGNEQGDSYGLIDLDYLANPKTMKVVVEGILINPERFDICGNPIIPFEKALMIHRKDEMNTREFSWAKRIQAEVTYEEIGFYLEKEVYDSIAAVKDAIKSLKGLNKLLEIRKRFIKYARSYHLDSSLNEYVIFEKYLIDKYGGIELIEASGKHSFIPDVCTFEAFHRTVKTLSTTGTIIPGPGEQCPYCTGKYSITDVKRSTFEFVNKKIFHKECADEYFKNMEIYRMTHLVVDLVYDKPSYELLPNEYNESSPRPWFLFHTPDGDIKIGWRKRVFSIEWQENFKPFDMSIFNGENVTKWCSHRSYVGLAVEPGNCTTDKIRGIHAWGEQKAIEYLKLVKDTVNKEN